MGKPGIKREYLFRPDRNERRCHKAQRQEPQIVLCPACQVSLQYFFAANKITIMPLISKLQIKKCMIKPVIKPSPYLDFFESRERKWLSSVSDN